MDKGAWRARVHGVVKSRTQLTGLSTALIICRLFDEGHSDLCEVRSHCSFDLKRKKGNYSFDSLQNIIQ